MSGETYDILNSIFNGQKPLRRTNPKAGENEYYYVVPGQNDWTSLTDVKTVDVPSADAPNPYLQPQNIRPSLNRRNLHRIMCKQMICIMIIQL